jgi:CubicO group peptidase (beta-lactamase class C family)
VKKLLHKIIYSFILLALAIQPGFSQELSESLDSLFGENISGGNLHGCVAKVVQNGKILHFKAYGYADLEERIKMSRSAIFDIASMSKPITAASALRLCDEGRFALDDPVKKYLPELGQLAVLEALPGGSYKTVPPIRDITVRDLICHTAGFGYGWSNDTVDVLYRRAKLDAVNQTPENYLQKLGLIPLKFQPGTKWEYSCSIDILGLMLERITGLRLDRVLSDEILRPLKMKSTGFYISSANISRLSRAYSFTSGKLEKQFYPLPVEYTVVPALFRGGGGLVSTAQDLANFCSMIIGNGSFNGQQVLRPETVQMMISNQIAGITDRSFEVSGYGLGIGVVPTEDGKGTKMVYWSGSPFNTFFFIDLEKNVIGIFLTQNGPFGHLGIREKFLETVENCVH